MRWTGALDEEVNGILYYPHNYNPARKYPLMVAIHGGPTGVDQDEWSDRWSYYHNLLAQEGCFILKPNYHGSGNHSQEFIESIKEHYYEYEIPDVLTGIDYLAGRNLINKDSLAVMGWSNGAIIATMLTVEHPDLFLAAGAGAGDVNWTSDFGTCRFGVTFDQSYFGGAPWDDVDGKYFNEAYIIKSPLFEMEKVKTPTIIFHGSEDRSVPRDQGWEYYRALQQIGKAPVRFLWFPGQPHGLQKITHQTRKIEEEMAWFNTYFFGRSKPQNEAVKKDSPLMAHIQKEQAKDPAGYYGKLHGNKLIPVVATVKEDSIAIGLFEITHAQYKSFDPDYTYPASLGNQPVRGLPSGAAAKYCQWLSKLTGDTYRLPNQKEGEALTSLAAKHAKSENTLTYWAGYPITKDEVPMLLDKIKEVPGNLIKAVGSFKPIKVGQAQIYDLGGNVAEVFQGKGESGTYGYSAYDFADPSSSDTKSSSEYTGFRVVKEL